MNCFSRLSSYTAFIFGRTSHFIATTRTSNPSHQSRIPFWRRSFEQPGLYLPFISTRFRIQSYSSRKPSLKASVRKKKDSQPTTAMENEKDAFFVVRKGDVVGVYKNFADCEAQFGTSILDPPVSVYKGYSLSKDSEAYLVSHGLQNALYTIRAADLKEDIFGMLIPCPFQQPASSNAETYQSDANKKRSQEILGSEIKGINETASTINKHTRLDIQAECEAQTSNSRSCLLEFDGASKGNPGQAGAGAVVRNDDGSLVCIFTHIISTCIIFRLASKHFKIPVFVNSWHIETLIFYSQRSCLLEFDGASKGNPGQAGAGAVLRNDDGSLICKLREGLGIATNNMAEYRAVLLGMKCALKKGYKKIHVKGDSKLVCMQQIQGSWKAKHENITNLYEEAKKLKNSFLSFHISHVQRVSADCYAYASGADISISWIISNVYQMPSQSISISRISAMNTIWNMCDDHECNLVKCHRDPSDDFCLFYPIRVFWVVMKLCLSEYNSEADAQANLAVKLASSSVTDGEVQEDFE
ncbi:hypothetical protein SADUNF_Sadunf08G0118800 [Salix dunnii]|uniref:RNase H type-1 domain-containing protein n=1 Tax=Salix dunnii TaxID=1413687 RepID=A0A835K079_9ROSI|nr:hypothetical protein SADUNF_Sadunf08G0118800 [Salix dunnii]